MTKLGTILRGVDQLTGSDRTEYDQYIRGTWLFKVTLEADAAGLSINDWIERRFVGMTTETFFQEYPASPKDGESVEEVDARMSAWPIGRQLNLLGVSSI